MAKQGQHKNDPIQSGHKIKGHEVSRGPNDRSKSVEITTGSYKKPESYAADVYARRDPYKAGQHDKNDWDGDLRAEPTTAGSPRAGSTRSGRPGSESGADKARGR
jgi:hypothetical protein